MKTNSIRVENGKVFRDTPSIVSIARDMLNRRPRSTQPHEMEIRITAEELFSLGRWCGHAIDEEMKKGDQVGEIFGMAITLNEDYAPAYFEGKVW